jgi:hypothetical protein
MAYCATPPQLHQRDSAYNLITAQQSHIGQFDLVSQGLHYQESTGFLRHAGSGSCPYTRCGTEVKAVRIPLAWTSPSNISIEHCARAFSIQKTLYLQESKTFEQILGLVPSTERWTLFFGDLWCFHADILCCGAWHPGAQPHREPENRTCSLRLPQDTQPCEEGQSGLRGCDPYWQSETAVHLLGYCVVREGTPTPCNILSRPAARE